MENFDFTTAFLLSAVPAPAEHIKRAFAFSNRLQEDPRSKAFVGMVLKSAADVIKDHGGGEGTVPYQHLKLAAQQCMRDGLNAHHRELYDTVCDVCGDMDARFPKQAAAGPASAILPAASLVGTSAKGLAYGGAIGGAALGALYWLLSRHARQNTAETESLEHKVDYYNQLAKKMESRLGNDYNYVK